MAADGKLDVTISDGLDRIRNLLEDMAERQRLSRFDNVVLLAYPASLALTAWVVSSYLQYQTVSTAFGDWYKAILEAMPWVLLLGVLYGLGVFGLAYLRDDLKGRINGCSYLVAFSCLYLAAIVAVVQASLWFFHLRIYPYQLSVATFFAYASIVLAGFLIIPVLEGPRTIFRHFVASWLEGKIPRIYTAAQRPYANRGGWTKTDSLLIKIGLTATIADLGSYLILLAGNLRFCSTSGEWNLWCGEFNERVIALMAVIIATVAVVFGSRAKALSRS